MECAKEGIEDLDISFNDNTPIIELFLARPIGLLCLLDEQCKGLNVRVMLEAQGGERGGESKREGGREQEGGGGESERGGRESDREGREKEGGG